MTEKTKKVEQEENKRGMRIKDVGATINLGNYSSLHITIGEESEFAGLDLGRAETYLRKIAKSVDGILNLPEKEEKPQEEKPKQRTAHPTTGGVAMKDYAGNLVIYDNNNHAYYNANYNRYDSVTQVVGEFYPFNSEGVIAQEYMDFAANFGNLIHSSIQNALIGKPPKKTLVKKVVDKTLKAMDFDAGKDVVSVEQLVIDHSNELAGRFDILTTRDDRTTLWDVKTNSNLYAKAECVLPDGLKQEFGEYWNTDTVYGEHCLQLNIYADILERVYGKKIDEIKIIHIPDDFQEIVDVPKIDISKIYWAYNSRR